MQTSKSTYKVINLQFAFTILVCSFTIKSTLEFITLNSFSKNKIELNQNRELEVEVVTELDEVIFNSKLLGLTSQILTLKKQIFDNYSSQIRVMYTDIYLLPPIL